MYPNRIYFGLEVGMLKYILFGYMEPEGRGGHVFYQGSLSRRSTLAPACRSACTVPGHCNWV